MVARTAVVLSDARHTDGADHRTQITAPTRTLVGKPDDGSRSRGRHPQRRSRPFPNTPERTCPRAVKRLRHNQYRVKKPGEPASIRHTRTATIIHSLKPRAA
jgi:hypothetical protein